MCKILFLKGTNTNRAIEYIDAFLDASSCDANLKKIASEFGIPWVGNCHNHWWGFLLITAENITEYTSIRYFLDDKKWIDRLKQEMQSIQWEFVLMSEVRVTDRWDVSAFNAHPFRFVSRNGYEWWLFYNGLLDYKKLAELEGIDFGKYRTKNGTTLMGISIANALESGKKFKEAMLEPKKALQSAYNAMFFVHDNTDKYTAYIHSFIPEKLLEKDYVRNHNSLIYNDEWDIFFVGNNSIQERISGDFETMENGSTFEFDIDFIEEYYFDGYKES